MHIPSHLSLLRTKYFLKKHKKTSIKEDIHLIKSLLRNADTPFLVGRLGFTESLVIGNIITKYYDQSVEKEAEQESGVFPGSFLTTILCASEQLFALNNCDLLANILWELTFYGWNPDQIKQAGESLSKMTAEDSTPIISLDNFIEELKN